MSLPFFSPSNLVLTQFDKNLLDIQSMLFLIENKQDMIPAM